MELSELTAAVQGNAAGFRSRTILQPLGGEGDKVFPATFSDGACATEIRRVNGTELNCVLLDSVASQANRAEEALLAAVRAGELSLPLIEVDFSQANETLLKPLANLSSLDVPHRLADAILRDSQLEDGTRFSKSRYAAEWMRANIWNATPIYRLCPTALVFGMWGSPEKPGGLGAKFERAFVSEIVGVDVPTMGLESGSTLKRGGNSDKPGEAQSARVREGFRIDPLSVSSHVSVTLTDQGGFVVAEEKAKGAKKPSEINHGNVGYKSINVGVRFAYAEQTTVISLGALRKLRFPMDGKTTPELDQAGRTVLAALALCAGVLASERGASLRSRCHLWPTEQRQWELLKVPGEAPSRHELGGREAIALLQQAVEAAERAGLLWNKEVIRLTPTPELLELVRRSQEVQAKGGEN